MNLKKSTNLSRSVKGLLLAAIVVTASAFAPKGDKAPGKISFTTKNDKHSVTGEFKKWEIKSFEMKNKVEDVKATIEVDITSVSTGMTKLDGHLQAEEFFNTSKHPKMTITIDGAKKEGKKYTTTAKVAMKGMSKEVPFTFEVLSKKPLKIKGEGTYMRASHGIGKAEGYYGLIPEVTFNVEATMPK